MERWQRENTKKLKTKLEATHKEGMSRGTAFVLIIFLTTHRVSLRDCPRRRFLFGFLLQSPFHTAICAFLHPAAPVLGSVCRSSWRNRIPKPELQMGSQGEARKSRPFSLDNSSGEGGLFCQVILRISKSFQLCILLFSSCCLLQLLRWQLLQGKDISTIFKWALKDAQGFSCHCNVTDQFACCFNTFRPKYL